MKEYLADRVRATASPVQGRNVAREYLQARILGTLQRVGAMMPLAFHGGTLLRFLYAILQRPYPKGRDIYDLLWYLSDPDWPAPNLALLNNALKQTNWTAEYPTEQTWRRIVSHRIGQLPWDCVVADVRPFVEPGDDIDLLSRDNVLRLLVS